MNNNRKIRKLVFTIFMLLTTGMQCFAVVTGPSAAATSDSMNSDSLVRWVFTGVIALLVLIIAVLANAIKVAGTIYRQKLKKDSSGGSKIIALVVIFSVLSKDSIAQITVNTGANSFSKWDIYLFIAIILLLFVVILTLVKSLFILMGIKRAEKVETEGSASKMKTWFQKFNETVPIEEEASLDMSHDYDGIRELDNKVPSWWTWTFIASILFAVVYLYQMFVSETLPNQYVELAQANEIAAEAKLEYLKKGANNVDENSVKMLGDAEVAEGAVLFAKNCVACHGDKGQGNTVGPNLTDDYWLHKGGIKDIFYSIKYGWAEKGMKSWKEDFSPMQIAQLSSFVNKLHGTNPPAPKEKQGELYTENIDHPADSTTSTVVVDTNAIKK